MRVTLDKATSTGKAASVDVWVDPGVRLSPSACDNLGRFEAEVLAGLSNPSLVPFSRYVAEVREQTGGALVVRTLRPISAETPTAGTVEDVTTRIEAIPELSDDLLRIPDGYQKAVHALEYMVAFAEQEAELNTPARLVRGATPVWM